MYYFVKYKLFWKTETYPRYGPHKGQNINKENRQKSITKKIEGIALLDLKYDDLQK